MGYPKYGKVSRRRRMDDDRPMMPAK